MNRNADEEQQYVADIEDSGEDDSQSHRECQLPKKCVKKTTHAPEIDKPEAEQDADISENMEDDASDKTVAESETDDFMTDFNDD